MSSYNTGTATQLPSRHRGGGGASYKTASGQELSLEIRGINQLRKDLKNIDRQLGLEVNRYLRRFTKETLAKAKSNTPVVSGQLRKSLKQSITAKRMTLYSNLAYAPAHEWGASGKADGRVRPKGVPIAIRGKQMLGQAVYSRLDAFEEHVMGLVDHIAMVNGFDD